jgi:hypothetical protein
MHDPFFRNRNNLATVDSAISHPWRKAGRQADALLLARPPPSLIALAMAAAPCAALRRLRRTSQQLSTGGWTAAAAEGSPTDADDGTAALRRKYREERDKRLRNDGNDQYITLEGQLSYYKDDPYTEVVERTAKTDHVTFAYVGAGFAGLCTGAGLVEAGLNPSEVRLVEKGGDVGGTWYWNRYPGAMCDTAAVVYMPLLEETGHVPSEKYAHVRAIRCSLLFWFSIERYTQPDPALTASRLSHRPRCIGARDTDPEPANREPLRPVRKRAVSHRGHEPDLGGATQPLARHHSAR